MPFYSVRATNKDSGESSHLQNSPDFYQKSANISFAASHCDCVLLMRAANARGVPSVRYSNASNNVLSELK